ncbi:MAG: LuxR family transcriptional regulator [Planctomycetota bacterium]|nr:MAG: LuxR family transcriptional regulator [Planctomycetota bacterium]
MGIVVLGDGWRIRGLTPTAAILLRPLTGGDCSYVPAPLRPEPHATIGGVARCVAGDFVLESEVLEIEPGEARLILRAYPFSEHERLIARATTLGLTPRQAEIARWVAAGKTNREIAVVLQISSQTVKKHVENILGRIGVENRLALASLLLTGP